LSKKIVRFKSQLPTLVTSVAADAEQLNSVTLTCAVDLSILGERATLARHRPGLEVIARHVRPLTSYVEVEPMQLVVQYLTETAIKLPSAARAAAFNARCNLSVSTAASEPPAD